MSPTDVDIRIVDRAPVMVLIGSTRFVTAFELVNMHYTLMGWVVISCGLFGHADHPPGSKFITADGDESDLRKAHLDALHLEKIKLADVVTVINVGGYIGTSTQREIEFAKQCGKRVHLLFQGP